MSWAAPPRLVHESLIRTAEAVPDKEALADDHSRLTYSELLDAAQRFARELQDRGLERGGRVALHIGNSTAFPIAAFGTLLAGGSFVLISAQTKLDKLTYVLEHSEASFLVSEGHGAAIASDAATSAHSVRAVYAVTPDGAEGVLDFGAAIAASSPDPSTPATIAPDLASLIYTSGTTGHPKGVMMSHGAFGASIASIAEYLELDRDDRILSVLPMSFTYGLSQLLSSVLVGATLLIERSFAFPVRTLARMDAEQATVFPAVPTIFATIAAQQNAAPHPSVRCLMNAAAGLPPALHAPLRECFPNARLFRMYGQTECVRVCYLDPDLVDERPTSSGKAMPGTEALVLDAAGEPAEPGEVGILHVRGPHLMSGYWRDPELTAKTLVDGRVPGERMLCTHDYFTTDADGFLYFVDRSDDIIKSRGEKVSSVEVENAIHDIPGVSLAAVIGVDDELLGQAVRAYVVLEDGSTLTDKDIIRECRERLESFMVPRDVLLVAELPQTPSGKVRKKSLVQGATPE
jgi:acyl-CoA synthetase (AMP-forming)/AMP-acid ligase II